MTRSDYLALIDAYGGHFKISEFDIQDSIGRIDTGFLQSFLAWRQWTGIPTMITSAWQRNDQRSHGKGKAIDWLLFTQWRVQQASALNHWLLATTWPFQGVGLYFGWSYKCPTTKADIEAIGLHVDGWSGSTHAQTKRSVRFSLTQTVKPNTMIKMTITLVTIMTIWLFSGLDWMEGIITAHNLANLALVILGILIASAASQLRLVLEKVENILSVYAKYTHPDSEDGKKLSDAERKRLFDLFLRELGSLVQEFGSGIFARIGKSIQNVFKAVGIRS